MKTSAIVMSLALVSGVGMFGAGRVASAAGTLVPVVAASADAPKGPLPTDERLVTGMLDNGLRYIIRRHSNPPGRAAMWIHVSTGSLNETDRQRGIAHYLEHMAFNGSKNFPPNSVIDFFQSMGLSFGRHQNAFTSFDQTTYQLEMPDNKPETMEKAMLFFSDVAFNLSLLPHEIDEERQIIMEEKRTRLGAQQRVQEIILKQLAPGSIFGERLPIGVEETIMGVQKQDFVDYYGKWYVPSNMTLIVVADQDPETILPLVKKHFQQEGQTRQPVPVDQNVGIKAYQEHRGVIAADAELTSADVSITWIEPAKAPTTTFEQAREDLVEQMASAAFNRRMGKKLSEGKFKALGINAGVQQLANTLRWKSISGRGEPGQWQTILNEMATELQRARLHGFSQAEIDDIRKEFIADAEQSVEREATRPARAILGSINNAVAAGEPVMSPQQELAMIKALAPTITAEEASKKFADIMDPKAVMFMLQVPTSVQAPSESELVELGVKALSVKPDKESDAARVDRLIAKAPEPATIAEGAVHEASQVWSGWLSNNVRVHFRQMDYKKDEAWINISLSGGAIQETAANRGITDAAMLAWGRPATGTFSSTQIRDFMTGKKVTVRGGGGADSVSIMVNGKPAELEAGMQLAHLMLTDPKIEQAAFDQWKTAQAQAIKQRKLSPQGAIQEAVANTIFPKDEVRTRPLEVEQLEKIQLEAAQAWLSNLVKTAPVEVAVVGDITREQAMDLVARYVGTLPAREKVSASTLDNLRTIERPKGPILNTVELQTQTPLAVVLSGFFNADISSPRDVRAMQVASRIISTRMIQRVREKEQLVYSISANSQPGSAYPGFGVFVAGAPTEPGKVERLSQVLPEMYAEFAANGPTEEELATAKKQLANTFDTDMKEPTFWMGQMQNATVRDLKMDDVVGTPAAVEAFTTSDIREAFAKYYNDQNRMTIAVKPKAAPAPAPAPAAEPSK
ncbi:MAG: insulinase family protein [Planctomycetota bacterium]|nr:insulinase family protein [Planctomycetota bacterium]